MNYNDLIDTYENFFIYIGMEPYRFKYGYPYKVTQPKSLIHTYLRVVDKDGIGIDMDRDIFDKMFIKKSDWRNLKLEQLGI